MSVTDSNARSYLRYGAFAVFVLLSPPICFLILNWSVMPVPYSIGRFGVFISFLVILVPFAILAAIPAIIFAINGISRKKMSNSAYW